MSASFKIAHKIKKNTKSYREHSPYPIANWK